MVPGALVSTVAKGMTMAVIKTFKLSFEWCLSKTLEVQFMVQQ